MGGLSNYRPKAVPSKPRDVKSGKTEHH